MKVKNHLPDLIAEYQNKIGRKIQQKEIAEEAQITESSLSRYINGHLSSLRLDIEYQLCLFFSEKLNRQIKRDDLFSFEFDETA